MTDHERAGRGSPGPGGPPGPGSGLGADGAPGADAIAPVTPGAVPYAVTVTDAAGELSRRFADLPPDRETGWEVRVAGRLRLRRRHGGLVFCRLSDWTGEIQLMADASRTRGFDEFADLAIGDWVAVVGEVVTTRRGELSVRVQSFELLAHSRIGLGDKWRGVTDPEIRARQRFLDLWVHPEQRRTLVARGRLLRSLRRRLDERGFVEVETPILQPIPSGGHAHPFVTEHRALQSRLYLRVAPELYLKRLVVGGMERIYEIGRCFRNEGLSPRHNPEFTMLECYQAYADYREMMTLTEELVAGAALDLFGTTTVATADGSLDLAGPWPRASLAELVSSAVGEPCGPGDDPERLRRLAVAHGVETQEHLGAGGLLARLYEELVEPTLRGPIFVVDYPAEVSPLARPHRHEPGLVERFEAVVLGRELANAFSELNDPDLQRRNFAAQAAARASGDEEAMPYDADYVRALDLGLPPTGGLGLGVDRLAMLLTGTSHIREVLAFPALRPEPESAPGSAAPEVAGPTA